MKPVTAIIVTYQSARTIGDALAAARRCHDAGLLDLVVVDNASRDATPEILAREAGWARVLLEPTNHGFGRGCNLGLAHVKSPYTLFLNPDAAIEPRGAAHHAGVHGAAPRRRHRRPGDALRQHGPPRSSSRPAPIPRRGAWCARRRRSCGAARARSTIVPGAPPMRTGWVCGALLMIRSSLARQLGGFDPRFFLYWEEIDLCRRAEHAGFENWVLGTALAHHVVGASSGGVPRVGAAVAKHYYQSRYYYMAKHHGWLAATAAELGRVPAARHRSRRSTRLRGRGLRAPAAPAAGGAPQPAR